MKSMAKEVILNLDFLDELCGRPTPEEEFAIEKHILKIKQSNSLDEVKTHAIELARQSMHQSHFIATCLERIAFMEAKMISKKHKVRQKKTLSEKFSMINAILFDKEKDS